MGYVFTLVAMGTGVGDWQLEEKEAETLGSAMGECARALPSKKFKAAEQLLGQVAPWIALIGVLAVILMPRVRKHRQARATIRGNHAESIPEVYDGGNGTGPLPVAGRYTPATGASAPSGSAQPPHSPRDDARDSALGPAYGDGLDNNG